MKHLLLLISFFFALHCQAQEPRMTEEEQRQAINTLMAYAQYVDSAYIQGAIERSAAVNAILTNHEQNYDTAFYLNNMAHLDSVIFQGIALIKQNKVTELLRLLEKERLNFYIHPNNLIDNEMKFHKLLTILYNKFYDEENTDQYYAKIITIAEFTKFHIKTLQLWRGGEIHPYYPETLIRLADLYSYMDNYEKAISNIQELCNCYEQLKDTTYYIASLCILKDLYDSTGMKIQRDSCEKILNTFPVYQACLKSQEEENDTTGMY